MSTCVAHHSVIYIIHSCAHLIFFVPLATLLYATATVAVALASLVLHYCWRSAAVP